MYVTIKLFLKFRIYASISTEMRDLLYQYLLSPTAVRGISIQKNFIINIQNTLKW